MSFFKATVPLFAVEVFKHASTQEKFLVLYREKTMFDKAMSEYPERSVFIGIGHFNHGHYTHLLIAPDGKVVIGTMNSLLQAMP